MYNKRVEYRKQGNSIQIIYKLLLNVSYGKLIEKLHLTKKSIVNADKIHRYCS